MKPTAIIGGGAAELGAAGSRHKSGRDFTRDSTTIDVPIGITSTPVDLGVILYFARDLSQPVRDACGAWHG